MLKRLAADGITCEVCPSSNVALGIVPEASRVPLRRLLDAGVPPPSAPGSWPPSTPG